MFKKASILMMALAFGCGGYAPDEVKLVIGDYMLVPSAPEGPDRIRFDVAGKQARDLFRLISEAPQAEADPDMSVAAAFTILYDDGEVTRVEISATAPLAKVDGACRTIDKASVMKILRSAAGQPTPN